MLSVLLILCNIVTFLKDTCNYDIVYLSYCQLFLLAFKFRNGTILRKPGSGDVHRIFPRCRMNTFESVTARWGAASQVFKHDIFRRTEIVSANEIEKETYRLCVSKCHEWIVGCFSVRDLSFRPRCEEYKRPGLEIVVQVVEHVSILPKARVPAARNASIRAFKTASRIEIRCQRITPTIFFSFTIAL